MHATSKMTYKLVFTIRFTCYTLECFVCHCYALKHSYAFDIHWNALGAIWYMPKCLFCQWNTWISFLVLLCLMPVFEWGNPLWFLYQMRWFQMNTCISAFVVLILSLLEFLLPPWICQSLAELFMLTPLLYKFFRVACHALKS